MATTKAKKRKKDQSPPENDLLTLLESVHKQAVSSMKLMAMIRGRAEKDESRNACKLILDLQGTSGLKVLDDKDLDDKDKADKDKADLQRLLNQTRNGPSDTVHIGPIRKPNAHRAAVAAAGDFLWTIWKATTAGDAPQAARNKRMAFEEVLVRNFHLLRGEIVLHHNWPAVKDAIVGYPDFDAEEVIAQLVGERDDVVGKLDPDAKFVGGGTGGLAENKRATAAQEAGKTKSYTPEELSRAIAGHFMQNLESYNHFLGCIEAATGENRKQAIEKARKVFGRNVVADALYANRKRVGDSPEWRQRARALGLIDDTEAPTASKSKVGFEIAVDQASVADGDATAADVERREAIRRLQSVLPSVKAKDGRREAVEKVIDRLTAGEVAANEASQLADAIIDQQAHDAHRADPEP